MPTRTRMKAKPATEQMDLKPVVEEEEFFDPQAVRTIERQDPDDDGTITAEPEVAGVEKPKNALAGTKTAMTEGQQAAAAELRSLLERVERLTEEAVAIRTDIKDVLGEAKGRGYDVKAIRQLLKLRSMDQEKLRESLGILRTYAAALGIDEDLV